MTKVHASRPLQSALATAAAFGISAAVPLLISVVSSTQRIKTAVATTAVGRLTILGQPVRVGGWFTDSESGVVCQGLAHQGAAGNLMCRYASWRCRAKGHGIVGPTRVSEMIFHWIRNLRRKRILAEPVPDEWKEIISGNVLHIRGLREQQRAKLYRLVQIFVAEKNWEGCGGLTLTDEMKVTIAAQACLLVVGMHDDIHFDHILSVLVYPQAYIAPNTTIGRAGVVFEDGEARLGEAWYRGPVILSWEDALAGGRMETPGHNLVLHEFAHQLDMMNGHAVDGTPLLATAEQLNRWVEILDPEYRQFVTACKRGKQGFIDCYGATNPGEFFSVLTEAFFERPRSIRTHNPQLYEVLQNFYQLDPAEWKFV